VAIIRTFGLLAAYCLVGALLNSCTASGYQEFQLYSTAYDEQYAYGDQVLTALGTIERKAFLRSRSADDLSFHPEDAAYYISGVEPPITASIRGSLKALKDYNKALAALGNGESAEALTNRVSTLTSNVIGTIAASSGATGTGAGIAAASTHYLGLALPFFRAAAGAASREAFRTQLIAAYPPMFSLLKTLRDGTPEMFEMLDRNGKPIRENRELMSGWVLLLDQSIVALNAAKLAAESHTPVNLAGLSDAAIEMRVLAEKTKAARTE